MRILSIAAVAGAAILVAACGGTAANNTANATDNGTMMSNDAMAPTSDMNAPMPAANDSSMNSTTTTTTAPGGNTTTTTTNTTNAM